MIEQIRSIKSRIDSLKSEVASLRGKRDILTEQVQTLKTETQAKESDVIRYKKAMPGYSFPSASRGPTR